MDEILFENKILTVTKRTATLNGNTVARTVIDMPDAVMVIAVDKQQNVHFLEEYMAPREAFLATFVKGAVAEDATPAQAAARELAEELALKAEETTPLMCVDDRPSHLTTRTHIFLATGCTPLDTPQNGDEEQGTLRHKTLPLATLKAQRNTLFTCARCRAALAELALSGSDL